MPRHIANAINWLVAVIMILFVIWQLRTALLPSPHVIHSIEAESPVSVGTPLCLWVDVSRTEICDPVVYRSYFRNENGVLRLVWETTRRGGVGGVGKRQKYKACTSDEKGNLIPLPPQFTPGSYITSAYVVNRDCRISGTYITRAPQAAFEVIP